VEYIARALRTGVPFTAAIKLVADEFGDPVSTEFNRVLDRVNFGEALSDSLKTVSGRTICEDFKFLAVSVIVHQETGGNLAEILENLARLIRERFRILGRIRVLSGEGRATAAALILIPLIIMASMCLINPNYMKVLTEDTLGRTLITCSGFMMLIGVYVIRRMISFRY
jgi:tight adherence protein B